MENLLLVIILPNFNLLHNSTWIYFILGNDYEIGYVICKRNFAFIIPIFYDFILHCSLVLSHDLFGLQMSTVMKIFQNQATFFYIFVRQNKLSYSTTSRYVSSTWKMYSNPFVTIERFNGCKSKPAKLLYVQKE